MCYSIMSDCASDIILFTKFILIYHLFPPKYLGLAVGAAIYLQ